MCSCCIKSTDTRHIQKRIGFSSHIRNLDTSAIIEDQKLMLALFSAWAFSYILMMGSPRPRMWI